MAEESTQLLVPGQDEQSVNDSDIVFIEGSANSKRSQQTNDLSESESDPHGAAPSFLRPGGTAASVYTLSAMSLGVGVFVLPLILSDIGIISGIAAIALFGLWSFKMQMTLIEEARSHRSPIYSLEELAESVLGPIGKFMLAFFTMVTSLIANAAQMKTVVLLLHDLMEWYITNDYGKINFDTRKQLILYVILLSLAFVYSSGTSINGLRFISTASVTVVVITCIWASLECMFWYWPHGQNSFSGPNVIEMFGSDWKLYAADLPAVAFAFTGTFCLFPVFQESEDKSHARMEKVLGLSTIICCFGYQIVSIIGGLTFGVGIGHDPFTGGNAKSYLYDFPPNHYAMSICCVAIIVVITLLYAVLDFPMVNAAIQTIRMIPLPFAIDYRDHFFNWKYSRRALTLCGMVVIVFINLQFDSLVTLFGLCGGWGISFVVYVIPSIIGILGRKSRTRSEQVFYVISLLASLGMVAMFTLVTFG